MIKEEKMAESKRTLIADKIGRITIPSPYDKMKRIVITMPYRKEVRNGNCITWYAREGREKPFIKDSHISFKPFGGKEKVFRVTDKNGNPFIWRSNVRY